jgi:DNA-binding beta-propeller fold protein YncE
MTIVTAGADTELHHSDPAHEEPQFSCGPDHHLGVGVRPVQGCRGGGDPASVGETACDIIDHRGGGVTGSVDGSSRRGDGDVVGLDVTARLVSGQLETSADDPAALVLGSIGRTEDVAVSPDGRRLALAGFHAHAIAIVSLVADPSGLGVHLSSPSVVEAPGLVHPHGVTFVDEDTLLVANRAAEVVLVDIAGLAPAHDPIAVEVRVVLDGGSLPPVRTPGSVATRWLSVDRLEVLTCNNYAHDVTRHVLDRAADWAVVDGEVLLARDLEIPDGIAIAPDGAWIAVSNHEAHDVRMYRYDEHLGPGSLPDGILAGPNYPHGVRFSTDGRSVVVADAGLPYVLSYTADDGDWSGTRRPARITRVMDDDSFHRGRHNPQEGGPKGVDFTPDGLVVVTSEFQPAAFFRLDDILGVRSEASVVGGRRPDEFETTCGSVQCVAAVRSERDRAALIETSTSWRITAPARRAADFVRRRRRGAVASQ